MMCLSIPQPRAFFLVNGYADVESHPQEQISHRGPVLIYASYSRDDFVRHAYDPQEEMGLAQEAAEPLPRCAIVGMADLVACTKEKSSHWHFPGRWGWYFTNPVALREPVAYPWQPGFYFDVPDEIAAKITRSIKQARLLKEGE